MLIERLNARADGAAADDQHHRIGAAAQARHQLIAFGLGHFIGAEQALAQFHAQHAERRRGVVADLGNMAVGEFGLVEQAARKIDQHGLACGIDEAGAAGAATGIGTAQLAALGVQTAVAAGAAQKRIDVFGLGNGHATTPRVPGARCSPDDMINAHPERGGQKADDDRRDRQVGSPEIAEGLAIRFGDAQ